MVTDIRLLGPALVMWIVTGVGLRFQEFGLTRALGVASLCVLSIAFVARIAKTAKAKQSGRNNASFEGTHVPMACVLLLCVALAVLRIGLENSVVSGSHVRYAAEQEMFASGLVRVTSDAKPFETRQQGNDFHTEAQHSYTVEIVELTTHAGKTELPRALRVFGSGAVTQAPRYGSTIAVAGKLASARPGEKTLGILRLTQSPQELGPPHAVSRLTNSLREQLVDLVAPLSPQAKALVPGAAIGDTRAMSLTQAEQMRVSGLTHITAVSGSHFAILFMIVSALTRKFPLGVRGLLMTLVCLGFVALVHPSGAVLRALVMGFVAIVALTLKRRGQGASALGLAMITLLQLDPYMANDFGFALSVLATGGLVALSSPLTQFLHRPRADQILMPRSVAMVIAVPVAAQIGVGPALLFLQPYVSLYSVPANIVAAPALAPAMLLGLIATACAPMVPAIAYVFAQLASAPTWWIAKTAELFSGLPGAKVPWIEGVPGAILLAIANVVLFWLCVFVRNGKLLSPSTRQFGSGVAQFDGKWRSSWISSFREWFVYRALLNDSQWLRKLGVLTGVALLCSCVFLVRPLWLATAVSHAALGEEWQVAACDVGQGDAFLARASDGSIYMFDVGPDPFAARSCVVELGVKRIDILFLSHLHADHYGGLEAVLSNSEVGIVVTGPQIQQTAAGDFVFDVAEEYGTPAVALGGSNALSELGESGKLPVSAVRGSSDHAWEVIWPTENEVSYLARTAAQGEDVTNNLSLSVSLDLGGGKSVAFLGDLESDGQQRMAEWWQSENTSGFIEHSIVKMAHHGSASQSPLLARLLSPELTLIGVGKDNGYGHPTSSAMGLYRSVGSQVLATHECGTFGVYTESERWFVVGACP